MLSLQQSAFGYVRMCMRFGGLVCGADLMMPGRRMQEWFHGDQRTHRLRGVSTWHHLISDSLSRLHASSKGSFTVVIHYCYHQREPHMTESTRVHQVENADKNLVR
jgi:hypothetical protein